MPGCKQTCRIKIAITRPRQKTVNRRFDWRGGAVFFLRDLEGPCTVEVAYKHYSTGTFKSTLRAGQKGRRLALKVEGI
jgi:hypothetical protein